MKDYLRCIAAAAAYCHAQNKCTEDFNYSSVADYVLDQGEDHSAASSSLDAEELAYLTSVARKTGLRFEPKLCFHNTMNLIIYDGDDRLTYCEGYAYSGILAVHHGWIRMGTKVIDLTRSTRRESAEEFWNGVPARRNIADRVLGVVPAGWQYLGVEFKSSDVLGYMHALEQTGSLIDNWQQGYPLFKKERAGNEPAPNPQLLFTAALEIHP